MQDASIEWKSEKRMIAELIPAKYNPRQASKKEENDLLLSFEKFSLADPLVINRNNTVIGGHFRLRLLQQKGIQEVDVRVPSRLLSEAEERELNLRLNKNTGSWDFKLLENFGKDMLSDVGFDSADLDRIFGQPIHEDDFDAEAEYQKIAVPKAKYGDIYQLGEHRLMCGDSSKEEDVALLMDGQLARMIFTDPPYNVDYKSPAGLDYSSRKFGGTGGRIFNDDLSDEECLAFYTKVLSNLLKFSTEDATIYWWFANKNNWINRMAFDATGWHMSQIIVWLKNSMIFSHGQDYHRQYEPCMLGWKRKRSHFSNKQIADLKDIFNLDFDDFNDMLDVWYQKRDVTTQYLHPTQKPVRLSERALKKNSERGDIVLDLFGGSGSTLLGCAQLERRAYLMELDPKYVDVIILRWERFTDKNAVKI